MFRHDAHRNTDQRAHGRAAVKCNSSRPRLPVYAYPVADRTLPADPVLGADLLQRQRALKEFCLALMQPAQLRVNVVDRLGDARPLFGRGGDGGGAGHRQPW